MNEVNATPHTELIAELMNPNNPKNEREHEAVREIERLREALAQPQEEPVAWINPDEQNVRKAFHWFKLEEFTSPVYTTPPQRKPLTDEQEDGCPACGSDVHDRDALDKAEREIDRLTALVAQPEQEPERVKFERHWKKTRGEKKANRELPRHPLQPQTYIQDSANRHWVTWQAAVRSVVPPAQRTWVALTPSEIETVMRQWDYEAGKGGGFKKLVAITEAKLKEKNT